MAHFRILHLSDFHFCEVPNRQNALSLWRNPRSTIAPDIFGRLNFLPESYAVDVADSVAKFVYFRRFAADAIVISGDLATTGMAADLASARAFVADPPVAGVLSRSQRPTLRAANLPVLLLPGNHDRFQDNQGTPWGKSFEVTFPLDWPRHSVRPFILEKSDNTRLAFVAADFCLRQTNDALMPSALNRYGQGRVYEDLVARLREVTARARSGRSVTEVVWVVHFAPGDQTDRTLRLLNDGPLREALDAEGIRLLLCGHVHTPSEYRFGNDTTVYCAGSSSSVDVRGRNAIHVVDIKVGTETTFRRDNYVWSEDASDFVLQ